jgi:hypothetical protein
MACEKAEHTFVREDGKVIHYCSVPDCKNGFRVRTGSSCYENAGNGSEVQF